MSLEVIFSKFKGKVLKNYSLKNFNWLKIDCTVDYLYQPYNQEELLYFLKHKPHDTKVVILGAGSNILFKNTHVNAVVIRTANFNELEHVYDHVISAEAGVMNVSVSNKAYSLGIGGLEFLSGIPGTIGGGVAMNAGAFDREFNDIIVEVKCCDYFGGLHKISVKDLRLSYRNNLLSDSYIFLSALLQGIPRKKEEIYELVHMIKFKRNEIQPVSNVRTLGSTFKNPKNYKAWQLLDSVGLRGYRVGGACFSHKHCNFIVNDSNATSSDICQLIQDAIDRVYDKHGLLLEPEIQIIETPK